MAPGGAGALSAHDEGRFPGHVLRDRWPGPVQQPGVPGVYRKRQRNTVLRSLTFAPAKMEVSPRAVLP